jgi:hypothetical protein
MQVNYVRAPGDRVCRLVIPYFGSLPNYMSLVLRSMAANPMFNWILFTDNDLRKVPSNVEVVKISFPALRQRIASHYPFTIALDRPYKLCDFRPAFGELFAEELQGYRFWGQCDLDVIFGQIGEHLPIADLDSYDKVLWRGNFALYKNTPDVNAWYRERVNGVDYRRVFSTPDTRVFDEWRGIYEIAQAVPRPTWFEENIFDLSPDHFRTKANYGAPGFCCYAWESGRVVEYDANGPRRTGLLVHLQKRPMRSPLSSVARADRYWILPDRFLSMKEHPGVPVAALSPGLRDISFQIRRSMRRGRSFVRRLLTKG